MPRVILTVGIMLAALATTAMQSQTFADNGIGLPTDDVEVLGQDDEDDGPSCEWIKEQVENVGSAYWRNRYYEECVSTIDD